MAVKSIDNPRFGMGARPDQTQATIKTPDKRAAQRWPAWVYALIFIGATAGGGALLDAADGQVGEQPPAPTGVAPNDSMSELHFEAEPVPEAPSGQ